MRSRWIEHNGRKILYQDFANLFHNSQAVKAELASVQNVVLSEPENSVLVISDFTNTEIGGDLMPLLNASSKVTPFVPRTTAARRCETAKSHVRKTAVVGVTGIKPIFGDLLSRITGQPLMYFIADLQEKIG